MSEKTAKWHASILEDYAHNCPAETDGGPGIEESLHAGAEALRRVPSVAEAPDSAGLLHDRLVPSSGKLLASKPVVAAPTGDYTERELTCPGCMGPCGRCAERTAAPAETPKVIYDTVTGVFEIVPPPADPPEAPRPERCSHGVWKGDRCYRCEPLAQDAAGAPQAAEPDYKLLLEAILSAAWAYDDKPHQLFGAIRQAAYETCENKEYRNEVFRLMDYAYMNRGKVPRD